MWSFHSLLYTHKIIDVNCACLKCSINSHFFPQLWINSSQFQDESLKIIYRWRGILFSSPESLYKCRLKPKINYFQVKSSFCARPHDNFRFRLINIHANKILPFNRNIALWDDVCSYLPSLGYIPRQSICEFNSAWILCKTAGHSIFGLSVFETQSTILLLIRLHF